VYTSQITAYNSASTLPGLGPQRAMLSSWQLATYAIASPPADYCTPITARSVARAETKLDSSGSKNDNINRARHSDRVWIHMGEKKTRDDDASSPGQTGPS
jgi:hypothetical protein